MINTKFLILPFLLLAACTHAMAGDFVADSLKVDGRQRVFKMYLPDGVAEGAPLVFSLHGYGGNGEVDATMYSAADRHGFAVCVPLGLKDNNDRRGWNVGYPGQIGWPVDDVKAMCRMARYVQKKYRLSRENTFMSGMSNGGDLCYLMIYSKQKVFKAFGSVAGLTFLGYYDRDKQVRPCPLLEIHGTKDNVSMWEGDLENTGGWGPYISVPLAVEAVAVNNGCQEVKVDTLSQFVYPGKRTVLRHRYLRGKAGADVWLYEVKGAPHCWFTDDMDTGEALWDFFSRYVSNER